MAYLKICKRRMNRAMGMILFLSTALFTGATCTGAAAGGPTNAQLLEEIKALKSKVAGLEEKLSQLESRSKEEAGSDTYEAQTEERPKFTDGLKINAAASIIVQGTIDANNTSKKNEDITDAGYSADLEFEKEFDDWGLAFVHLETGAGAGVEDELEVFSNVNRDADDSNSSVSLTEVRYEQYLLDRQLTLTAGKIDPTGYVDQNEIAHDETTQFLGRIFRNAPTIDFPDNGAGIRGLVAPGEIPWLELEAQAVNGNSDWEDIADNIFTTCQMGIKPRILEGLTGNYRLYGWHRHTNYTKWADPTQRFEHKYGFGASIDQQIMDIFTVFGRYSWCDPEVYDPDITSSSGANYSLEHTWSAGFRLNGRSWGRERDHFAAAAGMVMPSHKYTDAAGQKTADDEGHVEVYYPWNINEHLTLSPDLQIIWNPFGGDHTVSGEKRNDTITIIGCRGQVSM